MGKILQNKSNTIIITLILSIIISVLFCSIAYSALSTTMIIDGNAYARPQADVRITNFSIYETTNTTSSYEEFGKDTISTSINFNNTSDASAKYKIEVTNYGEAYVGIESITGLPDSITYQIEDYTLKDKICNINGKCNKVATKAFYITFYGMNTNVDITLKFNFKIFYNFTYINFNNNNYPSGILEGDSVTIDTSTDNTKLISIEADNEPEYSFNLSTKQLLISNVTSDINIVSVNQIDYQYDYSGNYKTFTAPANGIYKIQLWGAAGGSSLANGLTNQGIQGQGAYTSGYIELNRNQKIYIYVGGRGGDGAQGYASKGGYNGGGKGTWDGTDDEAASGGGGATDIRLTSGEWDAFDSLKSRIMVAAGGGGYAWKSEASASSGGGLTTKCYGTRVNFYNSSGNYSYVTCVTPDTTQTTGYKFGIGQDGSGTGISNDGSPGAGGGYYGGTVSKETSEIDIAVGGTSFISGHNGCNAIKEETTSSNVVHSNQDVHYSGYQFANTVMIDGENYLWYTEREEQSYIPNYDGTSSLSGKNDGYAKISIVSTSEQIYDVTYKGINGFISDKTLENKSHVVDFGSSPPEMLKITMNGIITNNYNYDSGRLVIPQVTGDIVVESIQSTYSYQYTGSEKLFTAPHTGIYKIELWGARGGYGIQDGVCLYAPGNGGYTTGIIDLTAGEQLHIYVGGTGGNGAVSGFQMGGSAGYNGGGTGGSDNNEPSNQADPGGGGGGATDIRYGGTTLNHRIMVAAGGGGSAYDGAGGHAGGLIGFPGNLSSILGGTQTTGYQFGIGANGIDDAAGTGGGGGGYWGGNTGTYSDESGAGGSSYISGHSGCVAIQSASSYLPKTGCIDGTTDMSCSYHFSGKKFTNTVMYSGGDTYPTHPGTTGEGYAIIKLIKVY